MADQGFRIDEILTNISVAYVQNENGFVADKVFPMVPVQKESDKYYVYQREDWFRDEAGLRGRATESAGGGFDMGTDSYFADKYSYHKDVTERDRNNAPAFNVDRDATNFVTQKLLLHREVLWANTYFKSGVWANELGGAAAANTAAGEVLYWSDEQSNPIMDIHNAKLAQKRTTGYTPNVLVLGAEVHSTLIQHPAIMARMGANQNQIITNELLAQFFQVDKIVVADAIKNNAARGLGVSMDFILGKGALLAYAAPNPGLLVPSAGYNFAWTGLLGASAYGSRISRISMDWREVGTERIEGDMAFDQKVVASDMGTFFDTIVE